VRRGSRKRPHLNPPLKGEEMLGSSPKRGGEKGQDSRGQGKNLKKKMKNVEQGMLIYEGE
jgi:hypothetical protein